MTTNIKGQIELRTARKVRSQLGDISDVSLWRWIRNPDLNFPKPTKISGRLYFRADEIDTWIEDRAASRDQVPA
jgi:predicted DNA-binding transcriptional regulator AlpA